MSSNKFLQRFEGKIQVVGKEGVNNVFGSKNQQVTVYTNNNFNHQNKNKTSTSLNKPKPAQEEAPKNKRTSLKKVADTKEVVTKKEIKKVVPPVKEKKPQNPFLISNPFYLDEEDKAQAEKQRKEREVKEKEIEKQIQMQSQDPKKGTTYSLNRSLQKKKNDKQWTKMGGLGANIGGDDWLQKKKKQDKMQQFSSQVKQVNKERPNVPKPDRRDDRKEVNPRQKALEYSKNVPKPVVRSAMEKVEESETNQPYAQRELSELQQYELLHEQYKNKLRNQM